MMQDILNDIADGKALSRTQAREAFEIIMSGAANETQIGAFLMGMRVRGETVEEITAGAEIMREKATKVMAPEGAIDTCGTGGTGLDTLNISTAVALVLAGLGVPVAKHGNRGASSKSGTADVLAVLGVNIEATPDKVSACISEAGVGFLFARTHHSAMKHVAPARSELGIRSIFNLLGPLSNPAGAKRQLLGVFDAQWLKPMAEVLGNLGAEKVWVVHGHDGMDEITTTGPTDVAALEDGKVRLFEVTPEQAGLPRAALDELRGGAPEENAAQLKALLDNTPGPYRDIVLLNAAAALVIADKVPDLKEGVTLAQTALEDGRAKRALEALIRVSNA